MKAPSKIKFPVSKIQLGAIFLLALVLFLLPAYLFGIFALHLNSFTVSFIVLLPVMSSFPYFLLIKVRKWQKLNYFTGAKFTRFPLLMFFDPEPAKYYRLRKETGWWHQLEEGDLLLRRHDRYLDGLILRQTGFYTHAGIAKKESDGTIWVYHAIGEGITKTPVTDFARCDAVMVLRITKEKINSFLREKPPTDISFFVRKRKHFLSVKQKAHNYKHAMPVIPHSEYPKPANEPAKLDDVRTMISESGQRLEIAPELLDKELKVYDHLMNYSKDILKEDWQYVITGLAEAYCEKKLPYDFSFDFLNPDRMSCVEFAWNCYKCFFPMHKVKRGYFKFFACMRTYILAPDLFFKSEYFECVYKSGRQFQNMEELADFCRRSALKFWNFISICILCQFVLLALIKLISMV